MSNPNKALFDKLLKQANELEATAKELREESTYSPQLKFDHITDSLAEQMREQGYRIKERLQRILFEVTAPAKAQEMGCFSIDAGDIIGAEVLDRPELNSDEIDYFITLREQYETLLQLERDIDIYIRKPREIKSELSAKQHERNGAGVGVNEYNSLQTQIEQLESQLQEATKEKKSALERLYDARDEAKDLFVWKQTDLSFIL